MTDNYIGVEELNAASIQGEVRASGIIGEAIIQGIITGRGTDYNKLRNRPTIDGITVEGELTVGHGLRSICFGDDSTVLVLYGGTALEMLDSEVM